MKIISIISIFLCVFAGNVLAETHTFTSADGQRTFNGTLVGYNTNTQVVTVRNEQGQTLHFNIDLISEKDREFVKANPPAANVSLDVRFDRSMDRQNSARSKNQRTASYEAGYKINLLNYTPQNLNNVEVEYLLIYRKDSVKGSPETRTVRGNGTVNIDANGTKEFETSTVNLESFFKRSTVRQSGGGCKGGGCPKTQSSVTRTERSRDSLVGCIAQVKVNGEVVNTTATAPNLLRQFEEEFKAKY